MTIAFAATGAQWDPEKDAVQFHGQRDGLKIPSRVSKKALIDYFGPADARGEQALLSIFQENSEIIFRVATEKMRDGLLEEDGSMLVRFDDLE